MIYVSFKGKLTSAGEVVSPALPANGLISYLIISNMSGVAATFNVRVRANNTDVQVCPLNLQLAVGESYTDTLSNISVDEGDQIVIISNQAIDYHFSLQYPSLG
jgi:hypothetical protein